MSGEHSVRTIEVTATALRKDLFNVLDRLSDGEEVRVRRKGGVLSLKAVQQGDDAVAEHQRKVEAALARGVREDWADFDAGDITDNRQIEWTPEDN